MEEIISPEEIKSLLEKDGKVKGVVLQNHREFILKEKGVEGLKKLNEAMDALPGLEKWKELNTWEFGPVGLEVIELLVIKKVFDFDDEKIKAIGAFGSRLSFLARFFVQYIGSLEFLVKKAAEMWKKYYTAGELIVKELKLEKNYVILEIRNFDLHPIHCLHLDGYFANMIKMASGSQEVKCQETKCVHRGDDHHEFVISW